ncbi:FAD-binding oxidoreductase [Candidatus Saccharibacteria bacterium]|nr:FAD-binding oxidoreductase [Candidatus Saccharibacteria bacterium]
MKAFLEELRSRFQGDIKTDTATLDEYSHDASMFEIVPKAVVAPKDAADVQRLVQLVAKHKDTTPGLSLTARSAGTDMSGGAINDSVIVDFKRYFTKIKNIQKRSARVEPGVFFRDFDAEAKKKGVLMPTYPASRDLCTVGGMVANNSGGEKSIEYGKAEDFVNELEFVFADGSKSIIKPLKKPELDKKMKQKDFEGKVYRDMYKLVDKNYDVIKAAKPHVSKDSTGYHLWNVWDREAGVFDLTRAVVGAQGTLGFVTDIEFRMADARSDEGLLVIFMKDMKSLGELIKEVVEHRPSRFESFDDNTLLLSIKFMPKFYKLLGLKKFIHLIVSLIPEGLLLLRGVPRLILMVSIKGNSPEEVASRVHALRQELEQKQKQYGISGFEEAPTDAKGEKFWIMRRYSFQILRSSVKDKHTAPFIDDLVVAPEYLPEFLPKLRKIIKKYKLFATIAGHMGDGNFHIIPLMNIELQPERDKILPAMKEVNTLVLKYGGSLSGEHNDGLVRGPWLPEMYSPEVMKLFREVKHIFDPDNIFNPHKKTDANWDYTMDHLRQHF